MEYQSIIKYATILKSNGEVEFMYNNYFFEIFESSESGFCFNIYSSNEKDENDEYISDNILDGGVFVENNPINAIKFAIN